MPEPTTEPQQTDPGADQALDPSIRPAHPHDHLRSGHPHRGADPATKPTLPNCNDIPPFTIAAQTQQATPSLDDLAAILAKTDRFTMRHRPLTDQLRYIAQQILERATWLADPHLYEIAVTLRSAADEAEKQPAGPEPGPELRDAVAHAFTTRLKATAPISNFFPGTIGHYGGITPHELADLALDVVRPHLPVPIKADAAALAAIGEKLAAARLTSCGHGITAPRCNACSPTEVALRTELAATYWELLQAITHDRQPYPTPWAYQQACAARDRHQAHAAELLAAIRTMESGYVDMRRRAGQLAAALTEAIDLFAGDREYAEVVARWQAALDELRATALATEPTTTKEN